MKNFDQANLDEKITHLMDAKLRTILERVVYGNQDSTFHSGPRFTCY